MSRRPNFTMEQQNEFYKSLVEHYGRNTVTSKEILDFAESLGIPIPYFLLRDESQKIGRGKYRVSAKSSDAKKVNFTVVKSAAEVQETIPVAHAVATVTHIASKRAMNVTESFIPDRNSTYVPFGFFKDLRNIIHSKIFYPVFIMGLSGNGKTLMVEQICAELGREMIRVNITKRTDETDLIGSYELIDGCTVRREGPVVTAMRRGAVLLLDEVDLGTEDILCLQPILEGKPYFDKKTGEVIHPARGFQVVATANTKGKGSADGRFIGTQILNEAFLERFAITIEQEYPDSKVERKILLKNLKMFGVEDDVFADKLVQWADVIRKSFIDGAVDEIISTRRLVHIVKAYSIFKDRLKALELCLSRFDMETKTAFLDLYTKVDADVNVSANAANTTLNIDYSVIEVSLSAKFNTEVKISMYENSDEIRVESHGRTTVIDKATLNMSITPVEVVIDEIVTQHQWLVDQK